jgi:hypothetical protein
MTVSMNDDDARGSLALCLLMLSSSSDQAATRIIRVAHPIVCL